MNDGTDRTDCPALELLRVAYHEAGHAVAFHAAWPPIPVESVTIVPDEYSLGYVHLGERDDDWRDDVADHDLADALLAEAETIALLAGSAAERAYLAVGESDLPPDWSKDHHDAGFAVLKTWDGVEGVWLRRSDYLERTRALLARPDVRRAVPRVAAALLRRRCLSGDEVAKIVVDCGVTSQHSEHPVGWSDEPEEDDYDEEVFSWSRW